MDKRPLISVVMPVYNCEAYIEEALESIFNQTYKNIEVIVVNDGSTDRTPELLEKSGNRFVLLSQENKGISEALNRGIALSNGEYLAFLDSDDVWFPEKLEIQMDYLKNHNEISMVFSYVEQFISPELPESVKRTLICPEHHMEGITRQAMLIRQEDFYKVGEFSRQYATGEFMEWYMRAKDIGLPYATIKAVLCRRRIHGSNTTAKKEPLHRNYAELLKAALNRRRGLKHTSDREPE